MNTTELAQLNRNVLAWEKQVEGFRKEAIAAEALAAKNWKSVETMEERIASDMARIEELERQG